jgi:hypothetical protein
VNNIFIGQIRQYFYLHILTEQVHQVDSFQFLDFVCRVVDSCVIVFVFIVLILLLKLRKGALRKCGCSVHVTEGVVRKSRKNFFEWPANFENKLAKFCSSKKIFFCHCHPTMLLTTTYETETDYSQLPIDTILIILRFVDIPTGP